MHKGAVAVSTCGRFPPDSHRLPSEPLSQGGAEVIYADFWAGSLQMKPSAPRLTFGSHSRPSDGSVHAYHVLLPSAGSAWGRRRGALTNAWRSCTLTPRWPAPRAGHAGVVLCHGRPPLCWGADCAGPTGRQERTLGHPRRREARSRPRRVSPARQPTPCLRSARSSSRRFASAATKEGKRCHQRGAFPGG